MVKMHIVREIARPTSFRVDSVTAMFDVPFAEKMRHEWDVDLPLETFDWQIGLLVGPSGCGKSTIAQELWPEHYIRSFPWDARSVLDNFPASLKTRDVVQAMNSVGFSSPPDWVKPYHALSTGQQMRCDLARAITLESGLAVFDEFTSVVDRTVAQIGSASLARAVRRTPGRRFIAVTCHEDVVEWLTPDWVYEPLTNTFSRRSLQRPPIELVVHRVHPSAWQLFRQYHYLSADLHPAAQCYMASWRNRPVAFTAALPVIGFKDSWRVHRNVVLPDYQGISIGNTLCDFVAALYRAQGKRFRGTTSHPSLIAHRNRSPHWQLVSLHAGGTPAHSSGRRGSVHAVGRSVTTWEYVGPPASAADARLTENAPRGRATSTATARATTEEEVSAHAIPRSTGESADRARATRTPTRRAEPGARSARSGPGRATGRPGHPALPSARLRPARTGKAR